MSTAEQQRRWRAQQAAKAGREPGRTGRPPRPAPPCGDLPAYRRHKRLGEPVDPACAAAWATYQRDRYQARKNR